MFLSLALAVNVAVYGWLGVLGVWSSKETHLSFRLIYLFIAGYFHGASGKCLVRPRFRGSPLRIAWPHSALSAATRRP